MACMLRNLIGFLISPLQDIFVKMKLISQKQQVGYIISGLPSLIELQLQQCYLPSVRPSSISFVNSSKSLVHLDLFGNNISNSIYSWLSHFTSSLASLVLTHNNSRGPIPANFFWKFCKLRILSLERNNLTGPLTEVFQKLSECNKDTLQDLYLSCNMFSGSLPYFTQFHL